MKRFLVFQKMRMGNMAPEGEISLSVDGIIAIEATSGTGDQMTSITLSGGRVVTIEGGLQRTKDAIAKPRAKPAAEPLSAFERVFGRSFIRDFFGPPHRI